MRAFAASLFGVLISVSMAAHGATTDFLGHWQSVDPKGSGITHIAITPNGGKGVDVRAYGDCRAIECDWGIVQGKVYTTAPKSDDVQIVEATFHFGFAHHHITFRKAGGGKLAFEMLTEWADNSRRHDYAVSGLLRPTSWVGPISQIWQVQPGLQNGWGGGARNGASPKPIEACTVVNAKNVRAVEQNGYWFVKLGGKVLIDVGHDEQAAMLAEAAFQHYKFDRRCTVGGPFKSYWKSADGFPKEKMGGAICLKLNPTTTHLLLSGKRWKIMDGVTVIADLGTLKPKAEAMLGLIRANKLTAECFIRLPDPLITFWLQE